MPYNHKLYLAGLKAKGFEPKVIYDIGACVLHWTKVAQRLWPDARIILASGYNREELSPLLPARGPDGFIRKPYSLGALEAELDRVMAAGDTGRLPLPGD